MKRAKAKKPEKKYTEKELKEISRRVSDDATSRAFLLLLCAAKDTLQLTEEQCVVTLLTANRYAEYLGNHIADMNDLKKSIKASTGLDLKGW